MSNYPLSKQMNPMCSDVGVSCCIVSDPFDFSQIYQFQSFADQLVQITWYDEHGAERIQFLEPNEKVAIKIKNNQILGDTPQVTLLNNGL